LVIEAEPGTLYLEVNKAGARHRRIQIEVPRGKSTGIYINLVGESLLLPQSRVP